jgi:endoglucanase
MQRAYFMILLIGLAGCVAAPTAPEAGPPRASVAAVSSTVPSRGGIFAADRRLERTVNLGNALEAPAEGDWGVTLQADYFRVIAEAGFTAVRVPINFAAHAGSLAPYLIDPAFLDRVDWVVRNAGYRGLVAILDMHNYQAMMDSPSTEQARFLVLWRQIAERFRGTPDDQLYFELLNEPNGNLDNDTWNTTARQALAAVRLTNPTRPVIIGPSVWNSFDQVPSLDLPDDSNLIVTFHYYLPFEFTHQGAEWVVGSNAWLGTLWDGEPAQRTAIAGDFDRVAAWAKAHDRPVFLGEFGAYSKGDQASRVRWTAAVARAADQRGFAWGYWEFCAGFGAYDPVALQWRTDLLQALIPPP